jgi:UDP-N-acetylglucosamine 2-epimerase (non-hydrolysing)
VKLKKLFTSSNIECKLLHTGQHFDANMSGIFFEDLKLDRPDYHLNIDNSGLNEVSGQILMKLKEPLTEFQPDIVIVVGDVISTFTCAFAACNLGIPVAHIESGLRSHRMSMPEERNRILTDHISSLLFVTEEIGVQNLIKESISKEKIKLVGNTMIDVLMEMLPYIEKRKMYEQYHLVAKNYILATFHRPINVDDPLALNEVVNTLRMLGVSTNVVFPMHPRTKNALIQFNLMGNLTNLENIIIAEPLGYFDFLNLLLNARAIVTDSGGVQSEASYLNIPCLTIRDETELLSTIEYGTNTLCPLDVKQIELEYRRILDGLYKNKSDYKNWDGKASERIVDEVIKFLN